MNVSMSLPNNSLQQVQTLRKISLAILGLGVAFLLPFVCSVWLHTNPLFYSQIDHVGILLIFISIIGRCWCTLYIGGRKKTTIVVTGPYSIVRNPLYIFTVIGAAGIGAQTGSLLITLACALLVAAVFFATTLQEEAFLRAAHGTEFDDYSSRVARFWPNFSNYRDLPLLSVQPQLLARTLAESSLLLVAIPAVDMIEVAREFGWLPEIWHLF